MKKLFTFLMLPFALLVCNMAYAQCDPPTGLSSAYSNNVSTFSWDPVPGPITYKFQFKFQWDTWDNPPLEEILSVNTYSITGLFQTAPFEWRVSTICGSIESPFSPTQSFATPCPQPGGLFTTNITGTTATLNWVAATGYNTNTSDFVASYRIANSNNTWTSLGHTSGYSINIAGLQSNTTYEWCVNQSCMYALSTPVISQFTTQFIACDVPTGLGVNNITATQANVFWNAVNGGINYSVQYKPVTSNTWSAAVSSNTPGRLLTGLLPATLYDWRVRANCNGSSGGYAAGTFTTYSSVCASYGINSSEWIDQFKLGSINRVSAAEIGGYFNSSLSTNLLIGSNNNPGTFSVGYNPGIVFGENYAVYIDFNRNGNFSDAGERVVNPVYVTNGGINNFSINIPHNVSAGPTKLRVVLRRSGTTIVPCATGFRGETEDYTVNLVRSTNANTMVDGGEEKAEMPGSKIAVGPNPSNGLFTIRLPYNISGDYEVIAAAGSVIQKNTIRTAGNYTIDITRMPAGIYTLRINEMNGKQHIYKLQKL